MNPIKTEIPQAEWDFRKISDGALQLAYNYEYIRELEQVWELVGRWHRSRIGIPGMTSKKPVTVKQALGLLDRPGVAGAIEQSITDFFPNPALQLAARFDYWLRPFSELSINSIAQHHPFTCPHCQPATAVRILEGDMESTNRRGDEIDLKLRILPLAGKTRIKSELSRIVDTVLSDPSRKQLVRKSGRGHEEKWHFLKELAAYRLNRRFGFSYSSAQVLVNRHMPDVEDLHDVLPAYRSSGGWSDAVKNAGERLKKWFPGSPNI